MLGITLGTMALIVVLSVFNGFENIVVGLFNAYNPEIVIEPARGKTIEAAVFPFEKLLQTEGVEHVSKTVQENVLLRYRQNQVVATLKGVDINYLPMNRIDTMIIDGDFVLKGNEFHFGVFGAGIAYHLGVNISDMFDPITLYYPNRHRRVLSSSDHRSFNTASLFPSGVFSVQQEYDNEIVIVDYEFAQKLFDYDSLLSAVEVGLTKGASLKTVQQRIENLVGAEYRVRNRFEQQELLYKVLRSEKLYVFLILAFIVLIAVFNVVGSLTMLILDKKRDIRVFHSMGAEPALVKNIFLTQGMMISLTGAIAGLILGAVLCVVQQNFGLLRLPDSMFYPVVMKAGDFVVVFFTIAIIGLAATLLPVSRIKFDTGVKNAA